MIEDGLRTATGALASSVAANIPVHVVQTFTDVALNATLALPGPKVVVVPNGAYTINAPLLVPSQTIVQLQPQAVLTRNITGLGLTHAMWQNSTPSTGNTDIAILGGQYTTATTGELFGFTKVTRLRIRDCYGSSISGGDYLMLLSDCVKVWIEELVHETADGAPGQDGIHIQGGQKIIIRDCHLETGDDSIALVQDNESPQDTTDLTDVRISNCYLKSASANGLRVHSGLSQTPSTRAVRRVRVSNCQIVGGNQANSGADSYGGIKVFDANNGGYVTDIWIEGVHVDASAMTTGNGGTAVSVVGAQRVTLSAVTVATPAGVAYDIEATTDVRLLDCESYGTRGASIPAVTVAASATSTVTRLQIRGGHYTGATAEGLNLGGASNVVNVLLEGVQVDNAGTDGVVIDNGAVVGGTGVSISACQSVLNAGYGVRVKGGCTGVMVLDNTLTGNSTGAFTDAGTATVRARNRLSVSGTMQGQATLAAGTVTVSTGEVSGADNIQLTVLALGGVPGALSIGTITGGTSFVINSSSLTDTSTVFWVIVH